MNSSHTTAHSTSNTTAQTFSFNRGVNFFFSRFNSPTPFPAACVRVTCSLSTKAEVRTSSHNECILSCPCNGSITIDSCIPSYISCFLIPSHRRQRGVAPLLHGAVPPSKLEKLAVVGRVERNPRESGTFSFNTRFERNLLALPGTSVAALPSNRPFDLSLVTSSFAKRFTRTPALTASFVQRFAIHGVGYIHEGKEGSFSLFLSLLRRRRNISGTRAVPTTRSHDFHKPLLPCSLPNRGHNELREKGKRKREKRRA